MTGFSLLLSELKLLESKSEPELESEHELDYDTFYEEEGGSISITLSFFESPLI